MCIRVVQNPVRMELQTDCERVRFWAQVPENYPQCVPGSEIQAMRIEYFPDTDSLYIDLADRAGVDTREIGIDIDQASKHLDLRTLDLRRIPFGVEKLAG
jgi:uncharacterized protein YuzE